MTISILYINIEWLLYSFLCAKNSLFITKIQQIIQQLIIITAREYLQSLYIKHFQSLSKDLMVAVGYAQIMLNNLYMFEIEGKRSGRSGSAVKTNSKIPKGGKEGSKQKIIVNIARTQGSYKDKSKSQCLSRERNEERRSIDVSKFMQTSRSSGQRKSRDKASRIIAPLLTENPSRAPTNLTNLNTEKSAELKWNKKIPARKNSEGRSAQRKKNSWNEKNIPYDCQFVLDNYSQYLTKYEQIEIKQYKKVYYIGHKADKRERIDSQIPQFDNAEKEYIYLQHDHIAYRYQILASIGKGSYGQVFRAYDHKKKQELALKMIKNDQKLSKQAFIEIKILSHIKEADNERQSNVVRIKDFVVFRKHVCILFELLSENLYELIIRNNYNGLNQQLIRRFAIQILVALQFLKNQNIIHCDLKPQNILLKEYNKSGIKLVDFGSSCFEKQTIYTYIQSRYYRAPQITLGLPYNRCIDLWSTGCILCELHTGVPVFPGENQYEQMKYMTDTLGNPSKQLLKKGTRRNVFYDQSFNLKNQIKTLGSTMQMFSKPLRQRIQDEDFVSFIQCFLKWNPQERMSPLEALSHTWIKKGLPQQLRSKLCTTVSSTILKRESSAKLQSSKALKSRSKSKDKTSIGGKISTKASHDRLKKSYGFKI